MVIFSYSNEIKQKKFLPKFVWQLISALEKFSKFCQFGLTVCRNQMEDKHKGFQEMVEKYFEELRLDIYKRISIAKIELEALE